jgi:hypothetical protein
MAHTILNMKLPYWDRIYFFVFMATVFAAVSYVSMLMLPLVELQDPASAEVATVTLLADGQTQLLLLCLLPIVLSVSALLATPRHHQPDRAGKVNIWISTILVYVFVILFIFVSGILFLPTAIMLTAAAVGSHVRRREASAREFSGSGDGKKSSKRS